MQIPTNILESLGASLALAEFRRVRIEQGKAKLAAAPPKQASVKEI